MLPNPQDHSKWYYVDFYMTNDYTNGTRIEGTKEDMQKLVDMLKIAVSHQENTDEIAKDVERIFNEP